MTQKRKGLLAYVSTIGVTVGLLSFLIAQGMCVLPHQVQSKAAASESHSAIEERFERRFESHELVLDNVRENIYLLMGAQGVRPQRLPR